MKPISKIMIDLFTLAIGPSHIELEIKHQRSLKDIGRICFDIEFQ
jgi:hypothetical protein